MKTSFKQFNYSAVKICLSITFITLIALSNAFSAKEKPEKSRLPADNLLFCGSASQELGKQVAEELNTDLSPIKIKKFPDGEILPKIETLVRNKHVFIIQSICRTNEGNVNDNKTELELTLDAARRASAGEITVVIPYFGYARQDRKTDRGLPISASLVATLIEKCGADRVLCVDLHCGQIQGFFKKIPVDNLDGSLIFAPRIASLKLNNIVIVSPDAGGMERAKKFKTYLEQYGVQVEDIAMINKERSKIDNKIEVMTLVGDVSGKNVIIVDDMCDTGGTLCKAAEVLLNNGANSVMACVTHGVFSDNALSNIENSKFTKVMVTDTIPLRGPTPSKLEVVSAAPLLAKTIERIAKGESINELFKTRG